MAGERIERINLTGKEAEIAYQQVAAELAETGRCKSNAPRRRKLATGYQALLKVAIRIKHTHETRSGPCRYLSWPAGRSVSNVNFAADVLHVEGDETSGKGGIYKPSCGRDCVERAIKNIDTVLRPIGGVKLRSR